MNFVPYFITTLYISKQLGRNTAQLVSYIADLKQLAFITQVQNKKIANKIKYNLPKT
jgi:hypothetical protein